ncbi:hypothetical protein TraAM80_00730 [Trypanosoma rangeli]|uniref:Uncharacterized protein n=1 Tax=Trypanosoma rangeli TaxID=5698 RepID=A0A3R7KXM9_TRYRA|nr:uncharacterized protein TraAM80_00730 [Trypanosoma rangeli]RNF11747.1 hypothetical protein TraAM80_00730 [Trypanosoma rangeli]|eukprot:RNF11747.1 hypothetical protein TraAM80_00730 [Trypanosoma rangeli]
MKYFSCQPDTHNGFGVLIGHTLTYFTVECSDSEGVGSSSGGDSPAASVNDKGALRVCAQHRVTLPHDFGAAPQCFSMANRSLYGFDMAIVGASTGVLAVVVMPTSGVVYLPGRSPASLCTRPAAAAAAARQGDHRAVSRLRSQSSTSTIGPSFPSPLSLEQSAGLDYGVGTITWMRDKPLVFVGLMSGRVEWYHVTIADPKHQPETVKGCADTAAEATVDECFLKGKSRVEQQSRVALCAEVESAATLAADPTLPSSIWMHNNFARRGGTRRTHDNGDGEGVRIRLQLSCALHETGAFLTSDWFLATGFVVAGAERAIYVFSTEQPGAPLYSVMHVGCSFLACHPFLPILACLSFGRSTGKGMRPDACVLHVFEWTAGGTLSLAAEKRTFHKVPRQDVYYSCSWKFSADEQLAICNLEEGTVHVLHLAKVEKVLETPPQEDTGATATLSAALPQPVYTFTREREGQLPLHSLVNIEFISAAMHAMPEITPWINALPSHTTRGALLREHMLAERMLRFPGTRNKEHPPRDGKAAARRTRAQCGAGGRHRRGREGYSGCGSASHADVCFLEAADEEAGIRQGVGAFSRLIGVNYAGEITAVPLVEDAKFTILGTGRFAVGVCASVFLAGGKSDPSDVEQRMKRRPGDRLRRSCLCQRAGAACVQRPVGRGPTCLV